MEQKSDIKIRIKHILVTHHEINIIKLQNRVNAVGIQHIGAYEIYI